MILIDYNQIFISSMMGQLAQQKTTTVHLPMVRHMVLNSIRSTKQRFSAQYGSEIVIATDNQHSWRKDVFPFYKANRKKSRESSPLDWLTIHEYLKTIREEIKENFPYKVFHIAKCEGDDIIGVIATNAGKDPSNNILIVSADTDYVQLQKNPRIKQWNPIQQKFVRNDNPQQFLIEHIAEGDRVDGIPNVLSQDNCLAVGIRQTPLTVKKKADAILNGAQYWERNATLIDLTRIPQDIQDTILAEYHGYQVKTKANLPKYLASNKLNNLMAALNDF